MQLSHQNPRKVVVTWASKEFANLQRMHRVGVPCPRPLLHREHMVLMSLVGKNRAAPQLRVRVGVSSLLDVALAVASVGSERTNFGCAALL